MSLYGELSSEKLAEESLQARQIVSEIMNFGVTQRQIWLIMYNLALELENVEDMQEAAAFIKQYKGSELFLSAKSEA